MNCEQFKEIIGMHCIPVNSAIGIITPFTFADGNGIEIFAQDYGKQTLFFDDGLTLFHLHSSGIDLGDGKRRWKTLVTIASSYGVTLSGDGVFEIMCDSKNPKLGFASMVSTLLGVASWEREQTGVSVDDSWLVDEVAFHLQAWKPAARLIERPAAKGFSGRLLTFDFDFDGQYIDAISPHSTSTGAELRKIIDLRSGPSHLDKEVLIIVDDRTKPAIAKQEIDILGRVAKIWPISSLISASKTTGLLQ